MNQKLKPHNAIIAVTYRQNGMAFPEKKYPKQVYILIFSSVFDNFSSDSILHLLY